MLSIVLLMIPLSVHGTVTRPYVDSGTIQRKSSNVLRAKQLFLTGSEEERNRAGKRLLVAARTSIEKRREVIEALISVVELLGDEDQLVHFPVWQDAVELLGRIKAVEAINVLVRYLPFNNGTVGLSNASKPAVMALVRIGEPSVPKLADAMADSRAIFRESAAQALGTIGGPHAKRILEQALLRESDERVRRWIEIELSSMSGKNRGQPNR